MQEELFGKKGKFSYERSISVEHLCKSALLFKSTNAKLIRE